MKFPLRQEVCLDGSPDVCIVDADGRLVMELYGPAMEEVDSIITTLHHFHTSGWSQQI